LDVWFDSGSMPYALAHIIAARKGLDSERFFDYMDKLVSYVEKENISFDYRNKTFDKALKEALEIIGVNYHQNPFKFPANFIAE
jgi:hypothetical protein